MHIIGACYFDPNMLLTLKFLILYIDMQCNCYFDKMTSSQRNMQSLFHGKTILSVNKCVIMNLWNYYE